MPRSIPTKELEDELKSELPDNAIGKKIETPSDDNPPPLDDLKPPLPPNPPHPDLPPSVVDEISEEDFMRMAEKRGLKIVKEELSDDQRRTVEAVEKLEKKRFALEHGQISPERYDELESIVAMDETELTRKQFSAEFKKENPKATSQETEDAYSDYYWIQRNIAAKDVDDEGNEIEVPKPKFDDRSVKWGEARRKEEATRIKENAKAVLSEIDTKYNNSKSNQVKIADYTQSVDKVLSGMKFGAFTSKFAVGDKVIDDVVALPDIQEEVRNFLLDGRIVGLIVGGEKQKDIAEIRKVAEGYVRDKYASSFNARIWEIARSEGLRDGKTGSSSPIQTPLLTDNQIDELENQAKQIRPDLDKDLPPELLTKRK